MSDAEDKAAAQGAYVTGAVALQDLREKDKAIERLEREVELLRQRLEVLGGQSSEVREAA